MSTRRAFLWMGMAFAGGTAVGGACGYTIGAAATAAGGPGEAELAPSGNAELDELRRLAIKAPIEELMERRLAFLLTRQLSYRDDEVLWRGVVRICDSVLANESMADRRATAKAILSTINQGPVPKHLDLADRVLALQRITK